MFLARPADSNENYDVTTSRPGNISGNFPEISGKFVKILNFRKIYNPSYITTFMIGVAQVPVDNALVLGNIFEYRHKSYTAKNRLFWLHCCRNCRIQYMGLQPI